MVHHLRAFPLAAVFVVAFFAGITGTPVTETARADDTDEDLQHFRPWSVGDYWKYTKEATSQDPSRTGGPIVMSVQSAERIENDRFFRPSEHPEEWRSHQVFRLKVWANQSSNTPQGPVVSQTEQERYHRTSDLGLAQNHAISSFLFSESPAYNGGQERYHEYYPPNVDLMFPFGIGDKWRSGSNLQNHNPREDCDREGAPPCNTTSKRVHTYTVLGKETLNMKLNGEHQDILTWRIHVLDELGVATFDKPEEKKYQIWWYSPEVCNVVKKEEYNAERARTHVWILHEYRCKGRDVPDPSYAIYDATNLSSIRRDGKLATPPALVEFNHVVASQNGAHQNGDDRSLIHLAERVPMANGLLLLGALLALAAVARRRTV